MTQPVVLFVVPKFHTNLFYATKVLIDAGMRVRVLAATAGRDSDNVHLAPQVFGPDALPAAVEAAMLAERPDLVLLRNCPPLSRHALRIARRHRLRVVGYDLRPATERRPFAERVRRALQGKPALRVTPVPGLDPSAGRGDPKAIFLPWPVEPDPAVAPRQPAPDGRLRVLCVGKLAQRRKRQMSVIEAVRLAQAEDRVRVTLVGSSSLGASESDRAQMQALRALAAETGWIDLREDVPLQQMPAIYAAHDLCILPAHAEPLGVAPLEGMAYGCVPVISTEAGSAGIISDGRDGYRIPPGDAAAIAAILQRLLAQPALVDSLSQGARDTFRQVLAPDVFVERLRRLLQAS